MGLAGNVLAGGDQPWIGVVQANEKNKGVAGLSKHSVEFFLDCAVSTLGI